MSKPALKALLPLLLIASCTTAPYVPTKTSSPAEQHSRLDFTSMDAFEAVASALLSGREPTEAEWRDLEESIGYATLLKSEFKKQGFREPFRTALMPGGETALNSAMVSKKYPYLEHYAVWAKNNLKRFPAIKKLFLHSYSEEDVVTHLKAALPRDASIVLPRVAITVFSPDARGYDPVIVDPSVAETFAGKHFALLLAHEFHHHQRNRLIHFNEEKLSDIEKSVYWTLDQLQAEGTADMINMPALLVEGESLPGLRSHVQKYRTHFESSPNAIRRFDQIISSIASGKERNATKVHSLLRDAIPLAGHPTGYFMATAIEDTLGKDRLLSDLANPVAFIRAYQNAAKKKASEAYPLFSAANLNWLENLEQKTLNPL